MILAGVLGAEKIMETPISPTRRPSNGAIVIDRVLKKKDVTKNILREQDLAALHAWPPVPCDGGSIDEHLLINC
jgi:hypothetical protein